jgi:hypothetical protein
MPFALDDIHPGVTTCAEALAIMGPRARASHSCTGSEVSVRFTGNPWLHGRMVMVSVRYVGPNTGMPRSPPKPPLADGHCLIGRVRMESYPRFDPDDPNVLTRWFARCCAWEYRLTHSE